MNSKWLGHYREVDGMTENQVFNAFFTSSREALTDAEKTELNQWIDEQRESQDGHNNHIG